MAKDVRVCKLRVWLFVGTGGSAMGNIYSCNGGGVTKVETWVNDEEMGERINNVEKQPKNALAKGKKRVALMLDRKCILMTTPRNSHHFCRHSNAKSFSNKAL